LQENLAVPIKCVVSANRYRERARGAA